MKYNTIISIFVCIFLAACNSDSNTNEKRIPGKGVTSNQVADYDGKIKNKLLDDLINLIEKANADREKYVKKMEEEPSDQYGMLAVFGSMYWAESPRELISDTSSERSIRYRRHVYSILLNAIETNELKKFSEIRILSIKVLEIFSLFNLFGSTLDDVVVHLYSKKDTLGKLDTSNLKRLKNLFEKLLSIKTIVSKMSKHLLLDYQNNKNSIKTDKTKLGSYVVALSNQIQEKYNEAERLKSEIILIYTL
ncbi:virulence associated lipoprotein [Borreliella garinii]|uniref:virulence associated lipoprotein n=2 Tax=Borreliella garinii TaxID=29519 RepID=UPI001AEF9920